MALCLLLSIRNLTLFFTDTSYTSDVKSRDSVLPQDSLETVFQCLGLGLEGWCLGLGLEGWCLGLGLGLGVVSWVKKQDSDSLTTRHSD